MRMPRTLNRDFPTESEKAKNGWDADKERNQ